MHAYIGQGIHMCCHARELREAVAVLRPTCKMSHGMSPLCSCNLLMALPGCGLSGSSRFACTDRRPLVSTPDLETYLLAGLGDLPATSEHGRTRAELRCNGCTADQL